MQNISGARSPAWNPYTVNDGKTGYMELLFPWQAPTTGLFKVDEHGNITAASVSATALTAPPMTDDTQIATTAYADLAVAVETSRAQTAEAVAVAGIASETARAEGAESLLAPLASPTFTGTVTIPAPVNATDAMSYGMRAASYAPSDAGLAAWTGDPVSFSTNTAQLPGSGTCWGTALVVHQAVTVSKLYVCLITLGSSLTSGESFGVLYSNSGALLGYTADQSTNWETGGSTGLKTLTLTAQGTGTLTLTPGKYWCGLYSVGTTQPKFLAGAGSPYFAAANAGTTGNAARAAQLFTGGTTQNTIPTSGITFTAGGAVLWAALGQ